MCKCPFALRAQKYEIAICLLKDARITRVVSCASRSCARTVAISARSATISRAHSSRVAGDASFFREHLIGNVSEKVADVNDMVTLILSTADSRSCAMSTHTFERYAGSRDISLIGCACDADDSAGIDDAQYSSASHARAARDSRARDSAFAASACSMYAMKFT